MQTIVPFTENALEEEAEALYFLLFAVALYQDPLEFPSIEEYNKSVELHMNMSEKLDNVDDAVELEVDEGGVTLSLSDEFSRVFGEHLMGSLAE